MRFKRKGIKRRSYLVWFLIILLLFMSPWYYLNTKIISPEAEEKVFGRAALIFGTRVTDGHIAPLLKERLEMGIRLYEGGKTDTLILSNTEHAAQVMKAYMLSRGIPEADIILDAEAVITRQSCETESARSRSGSILFVSQSFHLPRIYFECKKAGVAGQLVPAEYSRTIDRSNTSLYKIITIRLPRYIREMTILWGDIIFQKFIFENQ